MQEGNQYQTRITVYIQLPIIFVINLCKTLNVLIFPVLFVVTLLGNYHKYELISFF